MDFSALNRVYWEKEAKRFAPESPNKTGNYVIAALA
jgi:hypothetical protein